MAYRHHRLAAIKLNKDPDPGFRPDASLEELQAEMKKHWDILSPVLDLTALMAPADGTANQEVPQGGAARAGEPHDQAPQHRASQLINGTRPLIRSR